MVFETSSQCCGNEMKMASVLVMMRKNCIKLLLCGCKNSISWENEEIFTHALLQVIDKFKTKIVFFLNIQLLAYQIQ